MCWSGQGKIVPRPEGKAGPEVSGSSSAPSFLEDCSRHKPQEYEGHHEPEYCLEEIDANAGQSQTEGDPRNIQGKPVSALKELGEQSGFVLRRLPARMADRCQGNRAGQNPQGISRQVKPVHRCFFPRDSHRAAGKTEAMELQGRYADGDITILAHQQSGF